MGGGVEIECFADDRKAFTLTVSEQLALAGGQNFDFWDSLWEVPKLALF